MDEGHARHILEALRQLRSRLLEWHRNEDLRVTKTAGTAGEWNADRRLVIERYIFNCHATEASVAGLARQLRLSESRTIHLVKELFGQTYIHLVNEMRLRTAASLLRDSSLPILEVCLSSGFKDLSHFHRSFRRRFRITPLRYRRTPPA